MVHFEGRYHQKHCIPPKHHHGTGVMGAHVKALSEASYVGEWMKTMTGDEYGSVLVLL